MRKTNTETKQRMLTIILAKKYNKESKIETKLKQSPVLHLVNWQLVQTVYRYAGQ